MPHLLEFSSVSKTLGKGQAARQVLRDVSFCLNTGDVGVVVGPSGSGKSTLLSLAGLLTGPDKGKITLEGQSLSSSKKRDAAKHRRHDLGFIFQSFNLIPVLTALENVELALHGHMSSAVARREAALNILERVGLKDFIQRKPSQLSGGQQQRVGIARAIVRQPKIVIADEPTANLDRDTRDNMLELITEIAAEEGQTVLMSTHDDKVADLATRLFKIDMGIMEEVT